MNVISVFLLLTLHILIFAIKLALVLNLFKDNFNSFNITDLFLRPLKISENQRFSDVFRADVFKVYRKRLWREVG